MMTIKLPGGLCRNSRVAPFNPSRPRLLELIPQKIYMRDVKNMAQRGRKSADHLAALAFNRARSLQTANASGIDLLASRLRRSMAYRLSVRH